MSKVPYFPEGVSDEDKARRLIRERAKRRSLTERIPYKKALFMVRRSEVLVFLKNNEHVKDETLLEAKVIAAYTGVPVGVVKRVLRALNYTARKRFAELKNPEFCECGYEYTPDSSMCFKCGKIRQGTVEPGGEW